MALSDGSEPMSRIAVFCPTFRLWQPGMSHVSQKVPSWHPGFLRRGLGSARRLKAGLPRADVALLRFSFACDIRGPCFTFSQNVPGWNPSFGQRRVIANIAAKRCLQPVSHSARIVGDPGGAKSSRIGKVPIGGSRRSGTLVLARGAVYSRGACRSPIARRPIPALLISRC